MILKEFLDFIDPSVIVYIYSYSDCLDMGTAEELCKYFCLYLNYDIIKIRPTDSTHINVIVDFAFC